MLSCQVNCMQLLVQRVDIAGRGAFIHEEDARRLGVFDGDRLRVIHQETGKSAPIVVDITTSLLTPGTISLYNVTCSDLGLSEGDAVEVHTGIPPSSIRLIRKKMDKGRLTPPEEMMTIVRDMVNENLSLNEITAFVTASYINGMDLDEVESLTRAMVETGERIEFAGHPVVDKHSIGGGAGQQDHAPCGADHRCCRSHHSQDQFSCYHRCGRHGRLNGSPCTGRLHRR